MTEKIEQIDNDRMAKTEYTYDKLGNLVMVKSCLEGDKAQYVQYVYDIQGNKVRQFTGMTEPLKLTVTEVTDASDDADTFSYAGKTYQLDISGKKKTDTVAETKYEYDGKNRLTAYTDPEGRRETYTYDVNSNLTETVDKNGNTLKNTYDYQNRLTEMVAKEKKTGKETKHTYTYNAYGDVATQDDTEFVYDDASGQLTEETTKLTRNKDVVKSYTYDSAGNKSAFAVKVGDDTKLSLQYTYDGESKLTAVTDENGSQIVGYSYDMDGNLSERNVSGNNMTTTYTYDYQNRLTAMKNQTGSAGVISTYASEYFLNGKKSEENSDMVDKDGGKSAKTATYTYDLLGRIEKETKTGSEDISYTYDSNNNRKEMTVGNKVTAYKYNKNDELLRTDTLNTDTEEDSVVIYKNDRNGNQLATVNRYEIPNGRKDDTYVDVDVTLGDNRLNENVVNHYNALNQLTQTMTKNYKVSFTYDAEGLRTSKTVNGEKTVFVWDDDQLVMELSESGKVQKRYVRGNDLVYADKGVDSAADEAQERQYYVTDPHGNVVQLTDESGKVIKTYKYDSFGNEMNPDDKDDNSFRYCGEYYDKETEEIYLRARYYQPAVGRFLTRDTYTGESDEPLSLHLYTYCRNDGVNAWDPSGCDPLSEWAIGMGWLCFMDGPLPIGDIIYGLGLAATGVMAYEAAEEISETVVVPFPPETVSREQAKTQEKTNTKSKAVELSDVSVRSQRGRHYKLAYLFNNDLEKIGRKMTYLEALTTLGITSAANRITKRYNLSKAKFNKSVAKRILQTKQDKNNLWGIYADKKYAAKALAFALKSDSGPEIHGSGHYGHYHDKNHLIHIWYGKPLTKIYDRLANAAQ